MARLIQDLDLRDTHRTLCDLDLLLDAAVSELRGAVRGKRHGFGRSSADRPRIFIIRKLVSSGQHKIHFAAPHIISIIACGDCDGIDFLSARLQSDRITGAVHNINIVLRLNLRAVIADASDAGELVRLDDRELCLLGIQLRIRNSRAVLLDCRDDAGAVHSEVIHIAVVILIIISVHFQRGVLCRSNLRGECLVAVQRDLDLADRVVMLLILTMLRDFLFDRAVRREVIVFAGFFYF